ncbi:hypothetical protein DMN91_009169 [Ooceraea biroi]|uniref:Uncharacterized protein n=1 Tax=Ooceraea biroi TaxID=2015173 RepID=A0A3L8DF40_OOCBI|nr:hypothetical protein DMN91_009169 [Ooceraea biroi]
MYLCPNNDPSRTATQECFDSYPLYVSGTEDVRFEIPRETGKKGIIRYMVTLPPYVTCNMWGTCENGTEAVGCGRPETFRNCADVRIVTSTGAIPPRILFQNSLFQLYSVAPKLSIIPLARPLRAQVCEATAPYRHRQNMNDWCQANCIRIPSNCPPGICRCLNTCDAIGDIADRPGADQYCLRRCMRYPSNCPTDRCNCY